MKKTLFILSLLIIVLDGCQNKEQKTKWKWDYKIFMPVLLKENDTINYGTNVDTLYSGDTFKAKLYRQFKNVKDSTDKDMIKDFKGYFFKIKKKKNTDGAYYSSWTNMDNYFRVTNDTAYIQIPVDSLLVNADKTITWTAGYNVIFNKNNADTVYIINGTWYMGK